MINITTPNMRMIQLVMVCLYNKVCDEIFLCISAYSAQKPYDLSMGWVELDVPVQGKDYDL